MAKSHKRRNNIVKNITKSSKKTLKTVENTAKGIVVKSVPAIEKGISAVYGTMATGLDLGVKSAKTIAKGISNSKSNPTSKNRYRKRIKSKKVR